MRRPGSIAESPVSEWIEELLPGFMRRRITPEQAGEAVAVALERRRARVIAPRYWTALSVLRGLMNPPSDYLSAKAARLRSLVSEAEERQGSLPSANR